MTDSPVPSGSARPARALDIISVAFVALLLISNIAATKAFMVGSSSHYLIFDGGAILFPLTYIIGDVLSEVYGFARARRVIIMGFVASFLASLTFFIVQYLPPAPDYQNQDAFAAVLGVVWRAVLASLVGYLQNVRNGVGMQGLLDIRHIKQSAHYDDQYGQRTQKQKTAVMLFHHCTASVSMALKALICSFILETAV